MKQLECYLYCRTSTCELHSARLLSPSQEVQRKSCKEVTVIFYLFPSLKPADLAYDVYINGKKPGCNRRTKDHFSEMIGRNTPNNKCSFVLSFHRNLESQKFIIVL